MGMVMGILVGLGMPPVMATIDTRMHYYETI
jgi:hypothetical protein